METFSRKSLQASWEDRTEAPTVVVDSGRSPIASFRALGVTVSFGDCAGLAVQETVMDNPRLLNSPVRILLVDDFKPWRRYVCSILETRPDLQVVGEAADGLEAVQKAEELQPDIVLLDLSMPILNGMEASKIIRERCPKSRRIFLTENSDPDIKEQALRTGALGFVRKTDVERDLVGTIKAAMRDPYIAVPSAQPQ